MTQEEKAKAYDEAIERAKEMIKAMTNIGGVAKVDDIQYLFPELTESENERIRKWLIGYLEYRVLNTSVIEEKENCNKAIAWLEEQGEHKIPIEKFPPEMKSAEESLGIDSGTYSKVVDECIYGEQKPAEWSNRDDSYFEELTEASGLNELQIEWLTEIKDRVLQQPKQEWSEEDEVKINRIVACLENLNVADNDILLKDVDWLKSLRPQNTWKPSDEQMEALLYEVNAWDEDSVNGQNLKSLYQDLKKLMEE